MYNFVKPVFRSIQHLMPVENRALGNHRQQDVRSPVPRMMDDVFRNHRFGFIVIVAARV
jgi:hypothetical protein